MTYAREKRLLLGLAALLAPLPLPFNQMLEWTVLALFEVAALLLAEEHHLAVVELGEAGEDGTVIAVGAVAVQLNELVEDEFEVVERLRPRFVAGDLHGVPR